MRDTSYQESHFHFTLGTGEGPKTAR